VVFVCLIQGHLFSQTHEKNTKWLPKLLKKERTFDSILNNPDIYDIQIIYTQIDRKKNKTKFTDYHFNVNKNRYFYPSDAVFLPAAALTLEKINELSKEYDINRNRYVKIDNAATQEVMIYHDASSENHYASFSNFIKNMFVLGNENSYNFCYDFLGQRYYNERMHGLGYNDSWFLHKFNHTFGAARQSNTVTFFRTDVQSYYIDIIYLKRHPTTVPFYSVYVKKGEYNPDDYYLNRTKILLGKGFVQSDTIVDSAMNFTDNNKFTIEDMHSFLKSLAFPEIQKNKLNLSEDDYVFLFKQMMVNDSNFNHILNDRLGDSSIKIFNNSGKGMGFMIDNAYIVDKKNGVDFLLTVVIKCNKTDIFGEKYYEYETIGLPFMKSVSNLIYKYEIDRKKDNANLSNFFDKIE
jgi:hypothetical protein